MVSEGFVYSCFTWAKRDGSGSGMVETFLMEERKERERQRERETERERERERERQRERARDKIPSSTRLQ
jgi:hypothetical protein